MTIVLNVMCAVLVVTEKSNLAGPTQNAVAEYGQLNVAILIPGRVGQNHVIEKNGWSEDGYGLILNEPLDMQNEVTTFERDIVLATYLSNRTLICYPLFSYRYALARPAHFMSFSAYALAVRS